MNKQELVKAVSNKVGTTQVAVTNVLNAIEAIAYEKIESGEKLQWTGFLTIKPVYRAPRKGFDPLNNVPMDIEASVGISVKAGEKLRDRAKTLKVDDFRPEVVEVAETSAE